MPERTELSFDSGGVDCRHRVGGVNQIPLGAGTAEVVQGLGLPA